MARSGSTSVASPGATGGDRRRETQEPKAWTWTVPSADDNECPHGIADRAWCGFCSPAGSTHRIRNGR